jgi:DASS family divalent anion:Na+ symporter
VLATFIWFAVLFTLSGQLNELGFMGSSGQRWRRRSAGCRRAGGILLVVAYVLLHYLFVSQTAHLLALFGVFLDVGASSACPGAARLPAAVRHELLLREYAAGLEREPAVRGSGYLSQGDLYRLGALTTAFNLASTSWWERRGSLLCR